VTPDQRATIVITTKNSPNRLKRVLNYHITKRTKSRIIIADYSIGRGIKATSDLVHIATKRGLDIRVEHFSRVNHDGEVLREIGDLITTPYAIYCRDSDIAVRQGIIEGVRFLDVNSSYIAAGGTRGTLIQCGDYMGTFYTECLEVESNYITERLATYLRTRIGTTNYLHRTDVWKKMFAYAKSTPNKWIGCEVLPSCISVMNGKIKNALIQIPQHGICRLESLNNNMDFFGSLTNRNYIKSLEVLKGVIKDHLIEGGLNREAAEEFCTREVWLSVLMSHLNDFTERYPNLKSTLDGYSKDLEQYPFKWKYPLLSHTIIGDPTIHRLRRVQFYSPFS